MFMPKCSRIQIVLNFLAELDYDKLLMSEMQQILGVTVLILEIKALWCRWNNFFSCMQMQEVPREMFTKPRLKDDTTETRQTVRSFEFVCQLSPFNFSWSFRFYFENV